MKTRGIILAAGRGSRMNEQTDLKPKCMTVLSEETLLNWQLKALNLAGVSAITVVGGYRSEMLKGDFELVLNEIWSKTNMVSSLFCVKPSKQDSIISYADIVYKSEHIKKLMDSEGDIIITADRKWKKLWEIRFENPLDDAETFKSKNNQLIEIGKKTNDYGDIEAQYMGLLKFTPKGWELMHETFMSFSSEQRDKMDMTTMLNELLKRKINVKIVFVDGGWCEADTYSDILAYENTLNNTKNWEHDWR